MTEPSNSLFPVETQREMEADAAIVASRVGRAKMALVPGSGPVEASRMCNHYRNHPEAIQTWREYIGADPGDGPFSEVQIDVWPRKPGYMVRTGADGRKFMDAMIWGVPCKMKGKRPGTTVTKHVTNVRNLTSPFWKSMLATPAQRCLVPFTSFAEPKPGNDPETGRPAEHWFTVNDRTVAAFAGIWRPTEIGNAFAFLRTQPAGRTSPFQGNAGRSA